jgi:hypothetical protein
VLILLGFIVEKKGKVVDTESFIRRARIKFGDKFDYSLTEFVSSQSKVKIICPIHSIFETSPSVHLRKEGGCKLCANSNNGKRARISQEDFISRSVDVHKNFYDYSKVEYVDYDTKVTIICPIHSDFIQTPDAHLHGKGCTKCGLAKLQKLNSSGAEKFIKSAEKLHSNFYDYSKVEYINNRTKVSVGCPSHGYFSVSPSNHLKGKGCPSCAKSGYDPFKEGSFYILSVGEEVIKFGITRVIERRLKDIQNDSVYPISVLYRFDFIDGSIPRAIENTILQDSSIIKEVVARADMKQGYTETTYLYNLPKILRIVENFNNDPSS